MQVLVNLYSAHMDSDDWNQPQQFRPERFLDQSGNVVDRDRVIPFSLGKQIADILAVVIVGVAWWRNDSARRSCDRQAASSTHDQGAAA